MVTEAQKADILKATKELSILKASKRHHTPGTPTWNELVKKAKLKERVLNMRRAKYKI